MTRSFLARHAIGARVEAECLAARDGFSARYDLDRRAGVFSPSYWFAGDAVFADTRAHPLPSGARIWLVAGGQEGDEDMLPQLARMTDQLRAQRHWRTRIHSMVVPDAKHNESAWRADFPAAVRWLFGP